MVTPESYIETKYAKIWIQNEILFLIYKQEHIDLSYAENVVESRLKASNNHSYPVFVDLNRVRGVDKDARMYLAGEKASSLIAASALFGINDLIMLIANFYLKIDHPGVPVKFFNNHAKAYQWLAQYKSTSILS